MNSYHHKLLLHFLTASVDEVFRYFSMFRGAIVGPKFIYIPGKADPSKRVLMVAHADTVRDRPPTSSDILLTSNNIYKLKSNTNKSSSRRSNEYGYWTNYDTWGRSAALGADDRAGCAALAILGPAFPQHSILLTDEEESGCHGARSAASLIPSELKAHAFAIEIDRRGSDEMVFYDGSVNKPFRDWLASHLPNWNQARGSVTDISVICRETEICGVNFAAGFRDEHTSSETLSYACWLNTLKAVTKLLSFSSFPKFPAPDKWASFTSSTSKKTNTAIQPRTTEKTSATPSTPPLPALRDDSSNPETITKTPTITLLPDDEADLETTFNLIEVEDEEDYDLPSAGGQLVEIYRVPIINRAGDILFYVPLIDLDDLDILNDDGAIDIDVYMASVDVGSPDRQDPFLDR